MIKRSSRFLRLGNNSSIGLLQQQYLFRSKHSLPALDYPVEGGIMPCVSPRQLDFHYNKHHKAYVDKLNQLIAGTPFESMPLDQIIVKTAFDPKSVAIFNNAAQHFNHSFYWKCLRPKPQQAEAIPSGIRAKIEQTWGSLDKFQQEFTDRSIALFGSGWCWLVYDGVSLKIWSGSNAQTPIAEKLIPRKL
jgi:Fe-Mn family superoxide dismutase